MLKNQPLEGLRDFAKRVSHEGIILLENKDNLLPIINKKVAIYGRIQTNYYKSGTGSGGLVNVTDVPNFIDSAKENPRLDVNKDVERLYKDWVNENPFNAGNGMWASEPWSQEEMMITTKEITSLKRDDEIAIMIIGRTAGEDRDNFNGEGSYLLTKTEYSVIKNLKEVYGRVIVVLNVGNVIDLNFIKELEVDSLLVAWHGGQDGARATIEVLTGYINPSGKLPTTIVKKIEDYPASMTFGNETRVEYIEDIYVGYRYHETFNKNNVLYPFGYGLSYTKFNLELKEINKVENEIFIEIVVKNIGNISGKEVIQIYYEAPQGLLGKPERQLIAFAKTKMLSAGETDKIIFKIEIDKMSSYDDKGLIKKFSYVLEKGEYKILYGTSVRDLETGFSFELLENKVVSELTEALAPYKKFKRIVPINTNGKIEVSYEDTPERTIDLESRIKNNLPNEIKFSNNKYSLLDVFNKKISIDEFISTLSLEDLMTIIIGEGMSSPKVTSGTASAFAGVTDSLVNKGIPTLCTADGPSGIRMDSGMTATSLPNGALIASTFNPELVTKLYEFEGLEMKNYNIDILLGPGINILRHPLNGRNFEYFSEDPLLTGIMASAVIEGLHNVGVFGAMKHYAANNQETSRTKADSVVSERALREIYLKPFEIAVKTVDACVIMTAYNPINGIWAAGNYDLNTKILRDEWGYNGIVMTDWWASMNTDNDLESKGNLSSMIKSQNDLYMVAPNALENKNNLKQKLDEGYLTISELQRSARNILNFVLKSETFKKENNIEQKNTFDVKHWFKTNRNKLDINHKEIKTTFKTMLDKNDFKNFDYIEEKDEIIYAIKNEVIEIYGIKSQNIKNEFDDLFDEIPNNLQEYHFPVKNWDKISLNLDDAIIYGDDNWNLISKESIFTYPIKVSSFGKYIVEVELSSSLPAINQMPFSVYVDNINKQTITTNGTGGSKIKTSAHIVFDQNNKYLSFKFHKTGITVYNITVIKHG